MKTNANIENLDSQSYPDEIKWSQFFSIIWDGRYFLSAAVSIFTFIGLIVALNITPLYTSSTVISTSDSSNTQFSQLQSTYGSLASAAGLDMTGPGGENKSDLAMKFITSRDFFKHLIEVDETLLINIMAAKSYNNENKLIELDSNIYNTKNNWVETKPTYLEAHRVFLKDIISLDQDKKTGYITIRAQHLSPIFSEHILDLVITELDSLIKKRDLDEADRALNYLSEQILQTSLSEIRKSLNQLIYSQLQTQLMANISEGYFIKILDSSFIPDKKSYPPRSLVVIFFVFFGFLLGLIYIFLKSILRSNPI